MSLVAALVESRSERAGPLRLAALSEVSQAELGPVVRRAIDPVSWLEHDLYFVLRRAVQGQSLPWGQIIAEATEWTGNSVHLTTDCSVD